MKIFAAVCALFIVVCVGAAFLPALAEPTPAPAPEARQKAGDGATVSSPANVEQKLFTPRTFRVAPPANQAPDALEQKQSTTTDEIGEERDYLLEPGRTPIVTNARPPAPNAAAIRAAPHPVDLTGSQTSSDDEDDEKPD